MTINDFLKSKNLTKYRLAKMCGLPYGTLNDICIGKTNIEKCSGETLIKIADALSVPVDALLRGEAPQEQPEQKAPEPAAPPGLKELSEKIAPVAKKYKLKNVYVFGSYARNEACPESGVDLLIDREGSSVRSASGLGALYDELTESTGKEIFLVTLQSLKQSSTVKNNSEFIMNVLKEIVKIYGKKGYTYTETD